MSSEGLDGAEESDDELYVAGEGDIQSKEYTDHGVELKNCNYLDFFLNTYDGHPYSPTKNEKETHGWKPSEHVPYLETSGRGKSCQVIRKDGHETKVEFLGEWFLRNDDTEEHELYCAWMLTFFVPWREVIEDIVEDEDQDQNVLVDGPLHTFNEQDVELALTEQFSQDERLYANVGMLIADKVGIFKEKETGVELPITRTATMEDIHQYHDWEKIVLSISKYNKGVPTQQFLMMTRGTAGTGKSTLLNAITKTFKDEKAGHLLFKTAMLGVATSLIGGTMLHWWGGIPPKKTPQEDDWMDSSSKAMKQRQEENIAPILWLAIDEVSMMTTSIMTLKSQVARKVHNGNGAMDSTVPFGGLNLILLGDFHQFEPIANMCSSLYS
ncbi:hypothetical protein PILCRDRAFT_83281 [Piloderma croceum F 1598]|uniref:ATP-dependent DNA helicase n=1 Tax=Piloderma croceum (strain F 1598) TaxID=765440 RepID=A0A0C3CQF5_PILCF|nr:hypothetical protein PILCRDRAFT_83281 [Piloderma croceum F 1598]